MGSFNIFDKFPPKLESTYVDYGEYAISSIESLTTRITQNIALTLYDPSKKRGGLFNIRMMQDYPDEDILLTNFDGFMNPMILDSEGNLEATISGGSEFSSELFKILLDRLKFRRVNLIGMDLNENYAGRCVSLNPKTGDIEVYRFNSSFKPEFLKLPIMLD